MSSGIVTLPCGRQDISMFLIDAPADRQLEDSLILNCRNVCKDEPFFIANLNEVFVLHDLWKTCLPQVRPFYAVKANTDPCLIQILSRLGYGFDCASKSEIELVLSLGVEADYILYANPCKQITHLQSASESGVSRTTADNEDELRKMAVISPDMQVLIRIRTDDSDSDYGMTSKFGCDVTEGRRLVDVCVALGLELVGVSFHVGSGCRKAEAYQQAIRDAKELFAYADEVGIKMTLLDVGGGFPGRSDQREIFKEFAKVIGDALDLHFPAETGVKFIAEPGRYFSMAPFTLCTSVIGRRRNKFETDYYINDGTYGTLRYYPLETKGHYRALRCGRPVEDDGRSPSVVWGPTCCGTDLVLSKAQLPDLDIGDMIIFDNLGAYGSANASLFNGFELPKTFYFISSENLLKLM